MSFSDIIESLVERDMRFGIKAASDYVGLGLESPGESVLKSLGYESHEIWKKEVAEAANRLVYSPDTDIDLMTKSIRDGSDITPHAILEYDAILVPKGVDRDNDILHPEGGNIDTKMPLLFHHLLHQPIGKHVKVLEQNENWIKSRFAIADIPLGRDAAALVRLGGLRKSHGFKPTDYSPRATVKSADGKKHVTGWEVKAFNTYEGSLVSIPAHPDTAVLAVWEKEFDAVCTAFGRKEFETDAVKHWAKSVYDSRPAQARGFDMVTKDVDPDSMKPDGAGAEGAGESAADAESPSPAKSVTFSDGDSSISVVQKDGDVTVYTKGGSEAMKKCKSCGKHAVDSSGKCTACDSKGKSSSSQLAVKDFLPSEAKMLGMNDNHLEGSFQWVTDHLSRNAADYLRLKGERIDYDWSVDVIATFSDEAMVCYTDYDAKERKRKCWVIDYAMNDDGIPAFTGELTEVEVKPQVIEKAFEIAGLPLDAPEPGEKSLAESARKLAVKMLAADEAESAEVFREIQGAMALRQDLEEARELEGLV